ETYANGVVPEARGQAQRLIEDASGYRDEVISRAQGEADRFTALVAEYRKAPEVTRERLYLDTMQQMMSNTSKVLVTGDKGQNNLLYLPLDKMIDSRGGSSSSTGATGAGAADLGARVGNNAGQTDLRTRESR
ncbi:protease modulator HflK, partial [Pseudomonas sp. CrR14]|nr:protease modulator HflK [Pseudomonas sp. CrR14]